MDLIARCVMGALAWITLLAILGAFVALLNGVRKVARRDAADLALTPLVASRLGFADPSGLLRCREVRLASNPSGLVRAEIVGGPRFLQIAKRGGLSTPGILTGDPVLDTDFRFDGPAATVSALFDESLRHRICRAWTSRAVALDGGTLVIEGLTGIEDAEEAIRASVLLLEDLEKAARDDAAVRLSNLATTDSAPSVRRVALFMLLAHFPDRDETRESVAAARQDADSGVRRAAFGDTNGALALSSMTEPDGRLSPATSAGSLSSPTKRTPS